MNTLSGKEMLDTEFWSYRFRPDIQTTIFTIFRILNINDTTITLTGCMADYREVRKLKHAKLTQLLESSCLHLYRKILCL